MVLTAICQVLAALRDSSAETYFQPLSAVDVEFGKFVANMAHIEGIDERVPSRRDGFCKSITWCSISNDDGGLHQTGDGVSGYITGFMELGSRWPFIH